MKKLFVICLLASTFAFANDSGPSLPASNAGLTSTTENVTSDGSTQIVHYYGMGGYSHSETLYYGEVVYRFIDQDKNEPNTEMPGSDIW